MYDIQHDSRHGVLYLRIIFVTIATASVAQ
jgi:hypothetical protein